MVMIVGRHRNLISRLILSSTGYMHYYKFIQKNNKNYKWVAGPVLFSLKSMEKLIPFRALTLETVKIWIFAEIATLNIVTQLQVK